MKSEDQEYADVLLVRSRHEELCKRPVEAGHCIQVLVNGDEIFPFMLETIAKAAEGICFEILIYWSGDIAQRFAAALKDAAERGVEVFGLFDWSGVQKMDASLIEVLQEAGVTVSYFNPLRCWQFHRMNYRTRRKIMVVDRAIAFTGGVGIAQQWQGDARSPNERYEIYYRVTGAVVCDLREAFQELWS